MPELDFQVLGVEPAAHAAVPTLYFKIAISQTNSTVASSVSIQNIALQCQIRIDTRRRVYKPAEKSRLTELFGAPERWGQTLHSMLWTHTSAMVPAFEGERTQVDLPVSCSFDFNLAATKYFHGLEYEKVPLLLLFSGSVFYRDANGALAMDLISWNKETTYRLPYEIWQNMMDRYYPNRTWLCVNREVFDALYAYKRRHGYTQFDEALASLLPITQEALAS